MNQVIAPAPVRRSVRVRATPERAFEIFAQMKRWWPATHSINRSPIKDVVVEEHAGGRWYEVGEDGSHCQWGQVIAWEPPRRMLLDWQINGQWAHDPGLHTEVEIRFTADGDGTLVELEHRNLERFGDAAEAVRTAFESPNGWAGLLELYAAQV